MPNSKPNVFLDANIVISAGKPPGGPEFGRVVDLVQAGLITVVTTDLTVKEIAKKHALNDFDLIKDIGQPHFRRAVEAATGVHLPEVKRADLKRKLNIDYEASTKAMFDRLKATTLAIDNIKPSTVMASYAAGEGFFSGEGKKNQFPDAFIFECLKLHSSEKSPVIIVTQDGDFENPTKDAIHISIATSLADLFAKLGLKIDAPKIDDFLDESEEGLVEAVDRELANWGLMGDVEDSEIDETTVTAVEVDSVTAFRPTVGGDPILVVGTLTATVTVAYTHPDWDSATYDSEDKVLVPHRMVSGETEVDLRLDASMLIAVDEHGEPNQIEDLQLHIDDFSFVTLHPYEDDK